MNLFPFIALDGLHTAYLYGLSEHVSSEYWWPPFISSLLLYVWLGAWVSLREPRWVTKTIKSVAVVSFFGFLVVAAIFTAFDDQKFSTAALLLAITYSLLLVVNCLVALVSGFFIAKFLK